MSAASSIQATGQAAKPDPGPVPGPRQIPTFEEDTAGILARHASSPASMELHIHPTHYRFGGQEGIIPRNNPVMSMFFEYVREGIIPPVAGEVFKDSAVRLYDGCVILKLLDYRGQSAAKDNEAANGDLSPRPRHHNIWESELSHDARDDENKSRQNTQIKEETTTTSDADGKPTSQNLQANTPKANGATNPAGPESSVPSYRVLLRPTPSGLYQDLMCITDTGIGRKLTDTHVLSIESEILSLSVRKLDLRVPDRANWDRGLKAANLLSAASQKKGFKYIRHRATHPRKTRILHEDSPHKGTAYEDFMLVLADSTDKRNRAPSQFLRMSFIEQVRRKKYAEPPAASAAAAAAAAAGGSRRPPASNAPVPGQPSAAAALASAASRPRPPSQPTPEQLAQQVQQAQLLAQSQRYSQQPGMGAAAMPQHHVPPGPTASHQIQAQAQQQAVMRARAAQQMMRQQSPRVMPAGMSARPTSGQGRPASSMGQNAAAMQRLAHQGGQMANMGGQSSINGMPPSMPKMGMGMNGMSPQMNAQMNMQMNPQMASQMASQMNSQMSPQMSSPMNTPMNRQMGSQLNSQMNSQINSHMSPQLGARMSPPQMNSQMNAQMSPQMNSQMSPQMSAQMSPQMRSQLNSPAASQMNPLMGATSQNPQLMQNGRLPPQMQNRVARMPIGTMPNSTQGQQVPTQIPSQVQQQMRRMSSQQMPSAAMNRQRTASQNGQPYPPGSFSPNMG